MNCLALALSLALQTPSAFQAHAPHPSSLGHRFWVVDSSGAGDVLDLEEAFGLAGAGDLIVLWNRGATYSSASAREGLGISLVGVGSPRIAGMSVFRDMDAGQDVILRDVWTSLDLDEIEGAVWVEDLDLSVSFGAFDVDARNVQAFVGTRSRMVQGPFFFSSGDAVNVEGGEVYLYESLLQGRNGAGCGVGTVFGGNALNLDRAVGGVFDCVLGYCFREQEAHRFRPNQRRHAPLGQRRLQTPWA